MPQHAHAGLTAHSRGQGVQLGALMPAHATGMQRHRRTQESCYIAVPSSWPCMFAQMCECLDMIVRAICGRS